MLYLKQEDREEYLEKEETRFEREWYKLQAKRTYSVGWERRVKEELMIEWKYSLYVSIWYRTSIRRDTEVGRMMIRRQLAKKNGIKDNTDEWTMKEWYERCK